MPVIEVEDASMMFRLSRGREVRVKEYLLNLARGRLSYEEFWALRNVSFRLERGESLGLVGTNGSGKSTLLKLIAGIMRPTCGTVRVQGSIAPLIEINGGFDRTLSGRENIYLAGAMHVGVYRRAGGGLFFGNAVPAGIRYCHPVRRRYRYRRRGAFRRGRPFPPEV